MSSNSHMADDLTPVADSLAASARLFNEMAEENRTYRSQIFALEEQVRRLKHEAEQERRKVEENIDQIKATFSSIGCSLNNAEHSMEPGEVDRWITHIYGLVGMQDEWEELGRMAVARLGYFMGADDYAQWKMTMADIYEAEQDEEAA